MSTRGTHRARFMALAAALTMIAAIATPTIAPFASGSSAGAAPVVPAATGVLHLDVTSALKSLAAGGPNAGDHVAAYKWLIQQDTTGDPSQPSGPVAANDGTIACPGGGGAACTLSSPSAPFLYTPPVGAGGLGGCARPDPSSGDLGVTVSWTMQDASVISASIKTVCDAQDVILDQIKTSKTALPVPYDVNGTLLFSIQRADPCHPLTPATQQGDPNYPASCNWPSIKAANHAPIVTQGDQTDWNTGIDLSGVMQSGPHKGSRCAPGVNDA